MSKVRFEADLMWVFHFLLPLCPPEHRAIFAPEMLELLKETNGEQRRRGGSAHIDFVLKESLGLLVGAAAEWRTKFVHEDYLADQRLPSQTEPEASLPAEVIEARKHVQFILDRMDRAIASHQFEKASFYFHAEHKAREHLRLLQRKYNIAE